MTAVPLRDPISDHPSAAVLIVEDDPFLRSTLNMELCEAGFSVREAAGADEAETLLSAGAPIDVVVTDIEMPGLRNGLDLAKWVRAFRPHMHVIVVSGIAPANGIVGVADAFFSKPYDVDRLIMRIRSLVSQRKRLARRR